MADINKLNQIVQQAKAQGKTSDEIKSAIQKIPGLLPTNQKQPQKSTQVPSQQYTPQQIAMQESISRIPQGQYLDQGIQTGKPQAQTYTPQQIKMQEAVSRIPSGQYLDQNMPIPKLTTSQYTPQQIKMQEAISKIPQGQYLDQGITRTQQTPPVQQPAVQEQEAQAFETAMSLPNTENDILMQLQTNNNPTNDKSVNYGGAMQRYIAYNTFSNMQPTQIAQAMSSGQLIQGSKEWNDLMNSPNAPKLQEAISLQSFMLKQQVNNNFLDTMNVDTSKSLSKQQREIETTPDLEMAITQKIMQTMTDPSMAIGFSETIANDQQIQLARREANKTKEQIDGVQQSIVNLEDDLKAQIIAQGGVPTQGYLAALVAERSKPLIRQLEALNMTYSNQMGSLQMMTEEATARYESQQNARMMQVEALKFGLGQVQRQGDIQREQQAEQQKFERQLYFEQLGFDRDMAKLKAQQEFTQNMSNVEYQRELEMGDINYQRDLAKMRVQMDNNRYSIEDGFVFDRNTGKTKPLTIPGQYTTSMGNISLADIVNAPSNIQKEALIQYAMMNEGLQYKRGGRGEGANGVDCSGLLSTRGQSVGLLDKDMNSATMFKQPAELIPLDQLQPGDLIYYRDDKKGITHVGIAMGPLQNGEIPILDSSTNAGGVATRNVKVKNGLTEGGSELIGKENFMTTGGSGLQQTQLPTLNKMNVEQSKAFGFANRILESNKIIDEISNGFEDKSLISQMLLTNPWVPNYFKSDNAQRLDQASRDYINAVLRKESGSAISDGEFANAKKQYLPMPGDSKAVLDQKKRNRDIVLNNFISESGNEKYIKQLLQNRNTNQQLQQQPTSTNPLAQALLQYLQSTGNK